MLIGEVSRRSGVSSRMLRHYDRLGLVSPSVRTSGNYREYSDDDIRRLFSVESLRTLGMSLHEIRTALDDPAVTPAALVTELIDRTRRRIDTEQRLLARLKSVAQTAPPDWGDVLELVNTLRALESGSSAQRQQALLTNPDDLSVDQLVAALLAEEDPNVAGTVRWAIARAGDDAVAALSTGAASVDPTVRRRVVDTLARIASPKATALLAQFLDDPDADVREPATLELGTRADPAATAGLIAMVVEGSRDVAAAEVLGSLAATDTSIVEQLAAHLGENSTAATRLRITQALAEIPGPHARETLHALVGDPDPTVAGTARSILRATASGPSGSRRSRRSGSST